MEVAGLVLGVVGTLPLIIKAVRIYQGIFAAARVKDYMANLERDLSTETVTLNNTYERLLDGIVPPWESRELRAVELSSDKWRKYDHQIRWRLRDSYHDFLSRAKDIHRAVRILQSKLALTANSEVPFEDWSSIVSELFSKVRVQARFTLKRKEYTDTLSEIQDNNEVLSKLLDEGAALEPTRRANSRITFARTIRTTANSLYTALLETLRCHCVGSHKIGLYLLQRSDTNLTSDTTEILFDMIFCTVNGHHGRISQWQGLNIQWKRENSVSSKETSSTGSSRLVESLALEGEVGMEQEKRSWLGSGLPHTWSKNRRSPSPSKPRLSSRFPLSATATPISTDHESKPKVSGDSTISSALPNITDLCASIQKNEVTGKRQIGFIPSTKTPEGFDLYRHESLGNTPDAKVLTLRRALQDNKLGLVKLGTVERLNIALALSISILQLCNTPWLRNIINLDDIIFIRSANNSNGPTQNLNCPPSFLVRSPSTVSCSSNILRPVNFALLSLGILLTHTIVGHPVNAIDLHENMGKPILESRKDIAYKMVRQCDVASKNYEDAVQWCFQQSAYFQTLEDEEMCRDFHDAVIARLECDLSYIKRRVNGRQN